MGSRARGCGPGRAAGADAAEVQVGMGGAADDEEVGTTGFRHTLELGGHLAAAASEVAGHPGPGELGGDQAGQLASFGEAKSPMAMPETNITAAKGQ